MDVFWTAFFRPFITLCFFVVAWLIAKLLFGLIPDGKIKKILYSPLPWLDKNRR